MEIILFIIVLALLILVHEFGHFIVAKKTGMRVDEFGIGFPPRLFSFKKGETRYSLNLIPLGGFVKIFGEDPDEDSISGQDSSRSMFNKSKLSQAAVISAGVIFNLIFAWFLISSGFMIGLPVSTSGYNPENIRDEKVTIVEIIKNSPAEKAGLKIGDELLFIGSVKDSIQDFKENEMQSFIASHGGEELSILYNRKGDGSKTAFITPIDGIFENQSAIGIATNSVGIVKLNFFQSIFEGLKLTLSLVVATASGLTLFFWSLLTGEGSFSQISGPVGIVGMVGDAASFGFIYLLSFTAFISVNLAVINFIPFPALDGGRLIFIIIESIMKKNIKPFIANSLNLIGFALLIGLMAVVTYNDIIKLF